MNLTLYGNGSSGNHVCEAIVRGTAAVLGQENNSFTVLCYQSTEYGWTSLLSSVFLEKYFRSYYQLSDGILYLL